MTGPVAEAAAFPGRGHCCLHPGRLLVPRSPCVIYTLLGSCVAVCLFDREKKMGAMNHYLLPEITAPGEASPRYGNVAIERIVKTLLARGCLLESLQAKLFGGAKVLPGLLPSADLGAQNAAIAVRILAAQGIPIVARDVGGHRGRKVSFDTGTGAAWVTYLEET